MLPPPLMCPCTLFGGGLTHCIWRGVTLSPLSLVHVEACNEFHRPHNIRAFCIAPHLLPPLILSHLFRFLQLFLFVSDPPSYSYWVHLISYFCLSPPSPHHSRLSPPATEQKGRVVCLACYLTQSFISAAISCRVRD